ncbi:hypothetical protein JW851_04730 [Candidatus Woesearchaeota archaeon]|nr:hypothetical protein [Candidatus Woesearchaeota archaeon]
MDDLKMISYALLGIVAVIGVASLVLLFSGAMSAQVVNSPGMPKLYVTGEMYKERITSPVDPSQIAVDYSLRKGNVDATVRYESERTPSGETNPCYPNKKAVSPMYYDYTVTDSMGRPVPCEYVRVSEFVPRG